MVIRTKHIAITFPLLAFCIFLYLLNTSWGNPADRAITLSVYSFLMIFLFFNFYWELRDFWQYRWANIDTMDCEIQPLEIPIKWEAAEKNNAKTKLLAAPLIHSPRSSAQCPIVIFAHAFSDDKFFPRYLPIPIALAGFDVLTYDCRGTKGSRMAGNKNQFVQIMKDLGDVVQFTLENPLCQGRTINLVGISLGAMASIKQGLDHESIKNVVAVADMGDYSQNIPHSPIPFKSKWWVWLRFKIFGVPFNPPEHINEILSPAIQLKNKAKNFGSAEKWQQYIGEKLYLIHARNDHIIPLDNFYLNLKNSQIGVDNWVMTNRGGHIFRKFEPLVIASIIKGLNAKK